MIFRFFYLSHSWEEERELIAVVLVNSVRVYIGGSVLYRYKGKTVWLACSLVHVLEWLIKAT